MSDLEMDLERCPVAQQEIIKRLVANLAQPNFSEALIEIGKLTTEIAKDVRITIDTLSRDGS